MRARRFAGIASLVVAGALTVVPVAAGASAGASAKHPNPLANPTTNAKPSRAFTEACFYRMSQTKAGEARCDKAALKDFDRVRAKEGLGPMALPRGFDGRSLPAQLLTLVNIERVDRGLIPFAGLSKRLDAIALKGAKNRDDPPLPFPPRGNPEASEWAGGATSALFDDFGWMYDDGYRSPNIDCTSPHAQGCWGHRDGIIYRHYSSRLLMGAATAHGKTSMAMLFISGDVKDTVNVAPRWSTIARQMPAGVSAGKVSVTRHSAAAGAKRLVVRAYSTGRITAKVSAGAAHWSVSPRSCRLGAGKTCTLSVGFHAAKAGTYSGTLRVTGPGGSRTVKLVGHRT